MRDEGSFTVQLIRALSALEEDEEEKGARQMVEVTVLVESPFSSECARCGVKGTDIIKEISYDPRIGKHVATNIALPRHWGKVTEDTFVCGECGKGLNRSSARYLEELGRALPRSVRAKMGAEDEDRREQ